MTDLSSYAWPAAGVLATLLVLVAAMIVLAGRRDPELASRAMQTALGAQTIAKLITLVLAIPLIGILGVSSELNRTAAIAALAGIAGSAIGSAAAARSGPPQ